MKAVIVETDPMVRSLLERYLSAGGLELLFLDEEGLDRMTIEEAGTPDFYIVDFKSQTVEKESTIKTLRQIEPSSQIPILAIAGFVTTEQMKNVINLGKVSVLIKPFSESVFRDTMKNLLQQDISSVLADSSPRNPMEDLVVVDTTPAIDNMKKKIDEIEDERAKVSARFVSGPNLIAEATDGSVSSRLSVEEKLALIKKIPVKSALIVDRDSTVRASLQRQLKEKSVFESIAVDDGDSAWEHYADSPLDLVVLDWEINGLSSLALYNRIRNHSTSRHRPILVMMDQYRSDQFDEMSRDDACLAFVKKPFSEERFAQVAAELIGRASTEAKREAAISDCVDDLSRHGILSQETLGRVTSSLENADRSLLKTMDELIEKSEYEKAEAIGRFLIRGEVFDLNAASRLTKIYHATGRTDVAADVLRVASIFVPDNIDRLMQAGEIELNRLDIDQAKLYLERILRIEPKHKKAKAGMVVIEGLEVVAQDDPDAIDGSKVKLTGSLNAIGISFAKSKKLEEAKKYYSSAMMFVESKDDKAKLSYNIGLAYLRAGDKPKAFDYFQRADGFSDGTHEKTKNYLKQLGRRR